jgi:hypothetical protein
MPNIVAQKVDNESQKKQLPTARCNQQIKTEPQKMPGPQRKSHGQFPLLRDLCGLC